ncbi:phospholipase [Streptomyces sp. GMY02]|uniref:phospholipase n=1 Tax=Streptomyces sp. GMY02 TaxID=1333528 RepID=UPI001C2BD900|nr:phospholipase [Streptomyces sp. GMY02]QXE36689.1 phospholipase [Streptomyces sp. GMY02]
MRRRLALPLASAVLAVAASLLTATSATAAPADKPQVLSSWTQESVNSYNSFMAARNNQGAWSAYGFDWSTDYCSSSPDNPFGFPFQNACVRHDFGYRNYKAAGTFSANKARIDSAFYADLKRVCAKYSGATKVSCDALAWTYYHAVDIFGVSPMVDGTRSVA